MAGTTGRIQDQPAVVLHSYPYRETSLLLDAFSREYGRIPIVARGARRPRSALRGVLMSFQPLLLSWFGKKEVKTLHSAEWQGGQPYLQGTALMCGFYLNELLLNLMTRYDPHQQLFDYYLATLHRLAHEDDYAAVLRCFEKHMLQELGYALTLTEEAGSGQPVRADQSYRFIIEQGVVSHRADTGIAIDGQALLDMAADNYQNRQSARQSKHLMRQLLNYYLGGRPLHTRELIQDIQKL